MDARFIKIALVACVVASTGAAQAVAAIQRTKNFVVHAPTDEIARQIAQTAERCREELAVAWLGATLRPWSHPCDVNVKVGNIGAGGATTFAFEDGQVFGWKMNIQGSLERLLDSVVPHEVSHTIFATYFRRPLPRWADEGAATLVEHESERHRQQLLLQQVLNTTRRIPLKDLLAMKEYPRDMNNVLTLYAEGYSLADFLVERGGRARYLAFLQDAHVHGWNNALQSQYGMKSVDVLEAQWNGWIVAGSPRLDGGTQLAEAAEPKPRQIRRQPTEVVVRSQSPDELPAAAAKPERPNAIPLPRTDLARDVPPESAPMDRRDRKAGGALNAAAALSDGEQRAENAGWQTIDDDRPARLPRPKPLEMRIKANAGADLAAPSVAARETLPARENSAASAVPLSP